MLLNKKGQSIEIGNEKFTVGNMVIANHICFEFEGLEGYITEIRTGDDKMTKNNFEDICVEFLLPIEPERIKKLEEDFSDLYQKPKTIDDIILDLVIMAPDMLEIVN